MWSSTKTWNLEKKRREEEGKIYFVPLRARPVMLLTSYRMLEIKKGKDIWSDSSIHVCAMRKRQTHLEQVTVEADGSTTLGDIMRLRFDGWVNQLSVF